MRSAKRGSELPFPPAVLAERTRKVQASLRADGLVGALLFDPENIYYLTGFQSLGYFTYQTLLLPSAGRPTLVSRRVNQYLARVTPSLGRFVAIEDTADPVAVTIQALRRVTRGRLGLETAAWYLTAETYERLRRDAGRELIPWSGVVERERIVKTPDELARIRAAARAAEAGLEAAVAALAPGVSENAVAAATHQASIAAGSEYLGHAPLVASGERAGLGRRFAHRTGYAVGIGFPPNWSEGKTLALRPGEPTPLRPGMTFHVVPTVFADGVGVGLSETVAVTAGGAEVITRFPRDLITV
jgi:Xaa-Pro dipeptidase